MWLGLTWVTLALQSARYCLRARVAADPGAVASITNTVSCTSNTSPNRSSSFSWGRVKSWMSKGKVKGLYVCLVFLTWIYKHSSSWYFSVCLKIWTTTCMHLWWLTPVSIIILVVFIYNTYMSGTLFYNKQWLINGLTFVSIYKRKIKWYCRGLIYISKHNKTWMGNKNILYPLFSGYAIYAKHLNTSISSPVADELVEPQTPPEGCGDTEPCQHVCRPGPPSPACWASLACLQGKIVRSRLPYRTSNTKQW